MASKPERRRPRRAELLRQAKLYMKDRAWIEEIGLGAEDVADWMAEDAEVASAVTHGDLRWRSGHVEAACVGHGRSLLDVEAH
jgi:hypothetical protein